MSRFDEAVTATTPRLVVMFRQQNGTDVFQWGLVGTIPMMSLIGRIVRVQDELPLIEPGGDRHDCPQQALVIAWDAERRAFDCFVHRDAPVDAMLGMLETIKATLTATHMARQAAAQQVQILGPDGQPIQR